MIIHRFGRWCVRILVGSSILCGLAHAQDQTLRIDGFPPKLPMMMGSAWHMYLDGPIDANAAKRLEAYIERNRVPTMSHVVLNSPGGNLVGGMLLGRVIRKHGLNTSVGKRKPAAKEAWESSPGVCFSACALAYVGGKFRYLSSSSRYGVHRFYFSKNEAADADLAQVVSAAIVNYLREMGIDTDLFELSTRAGKNEIFEPSKIDLEQLKVVNNGFPEPTWTVESVQGQLYLKGERETSFGMNKFISFCADKRLVLYAIIDPQGRDDEVMAMQAHTLVIDDNYFKVSPSDKRIHNRWLHIYLTLSPEQVRLLRNASKVGVIAQWAYGAPVFLGFQSMPFTQGREKFIGLANACL